MTDPNHVVSAEHRAAFRLIESHLRNAISYSEAYGGPIVDGTQYSPSDRALPYVEQVWSDSSADEWEHFDWALTDLYDALGLVWEDGVLWRAEDCPAEDS